MHVLTLPLSSRTNVKFHRPLFLLICFDFCTFFVPVLVNSQAFRRSKMSATATIASTAEIELQTHPCPQLVSGKDTSPLPSDRAHTSRWNDLDNNFAPAEPLNIIEASRIADSGVPEGGYGWVVIAGCATLTWWYLGMSYSWGIMQSALVERGLSSASTLSWIGSLCVTFNSIGALVCAKFIRAVGTRQAALAGIICLGGGSVLSGFCTHNVVGLFFTSGVIMGLGTR